ncbi:peptidoglycan-binding protein [Patescibacteria group bacterium]|nr:peptidoglycan-binding protein [Patescibacteria group bacterium]
MYKFRKTKIAKALSVATGLVVGLTMVANSVSAMTLEEAEAKIAELSAMIAAMQAAQQTTPVTPVATGYTFSRNLKKGNTGADVLELQKLLNTNVATQVATTGNGSPGNETEYFGSMTKAAVVKFQNLYADEVLSPIGLTAGTGYVGTMTLAKLNALSTVPSDIWDDTWEDTTWEDTTGEDTTSTTSDIATGPVTVSLADSSPVGAALVALQAGAKIADFKFSGTGTITSVTLKQSGFSTQDALTNVYLYDGATRLTDGYTFNSAGNLVMNNLNIAVAGERVISVKADVVGSVTGSHSTIAVSLVGYTADGVAETTQVNGNMVQFVAGSLADVTLAVPNTVGTPTVNAGTMNYTIWGNSLAVSTRSVNLGGAIFKIIGSAPGTSLENVRLMIDGVQAGEAATVDTSGNVVFSFSATPIALATGSHTVELRADIVGGSNRSFYVSLGSAGDLVLADTQYSGANVSISSGYVAANYNSGVITIGAGTISLTKDTTFDASTNVTSGASNIAIAKYKIKAYGEDMKVKQVTVTLTETGPGDTGLNNVGVYAGGGQVGSSQNLAAGAASLTYNLGSALIIPAGTEVVVEIRTDLITAAGTAFTGAIATDIIVPTSQAQGMSSQSLTQAGSPGTTSVTSSAVTATVAKSLSVANQTVSGNTTNKLIGEYVIQAGTTEGVRVTNLAVAFTGAQGTATTSAIEITDIANLTVSVDGGTQMAPVNPSATNNFSVDFTVAKGTTKTVRVYADITAATDTETITTTLTATARGAVSNTTISLSAVTGQTMTVGSGALAVLSVVSSADTAAQYLVGATSAQKIITYNVTSTGGDSTIQEMTFDITGSLTGAITSIQVAGNQGGTPCSAPVVGTSSVPLTGCAIKVPLGYAGTALTVTANLGTVGMGGIASNASALMDISTIKYTNGVTSVTVNADGTLAPNLADVATSSTMKLVASVPTFTLATSVSTLTNGEVKVGTVSITANAAGNINLNILPVSVTVSGGALLNGSTTEHVNAIVLKEGSMVIATTDNVTTDVATAAALVTLTNDFVVSAGTTRTFDIYAYFKTVTGGDDSAQISLADAADLNWDDVSGNGTGLTGTLISTYPTNAVTVND